jgi:hypothetical protein
MCLNLTDSGVIDGCGADASWQVDPTGGTTTPEIKAAWDIGHRTMMRDTTLALGDGLLRESISIVPFALYSTVLNDCFKFIPPRMAQCCMPSLRPPLHPMWLGVHVVDSPSPAR